VTFDALWPLIPAKRDLVINVGDLRDGLDLYYERGDLLKDKVSIVGIEVVGSRVEAKRNRIQAC
jgi:hypothetical protein